MNYGLKILMGPLGCKYKWVYKLLRIIGSKNFYELWAANVNGSANLYEL